MTGRYSGLATRNLHSFSTEIIKPSISTSNTNHPDRYNLSLMDQTLLRNYMPVVFFYPCTSSEEVSEKTRRLKNSFAKTLAAYYPFAGRLIESKACVDCNDEGAEFQESRIKCTLSEFVKKYEEDLDHLDLVFPDSSVFRTFDNNTSPLLVRVNYFDCGGVAIALCMLHLIGDGATMANFMSYWATATRQSGDQESPLIISSPSCNDNFQESIYPIQQPGVPLTRFVFMNSELAKLRAKVCSSDGQIPSRYEFLSRLFYKCFMAVEKSRSGSFKPSMLYQTLNMRSKLVPALPKTTLGNWSWRSIAKTRTESESSWNNLLDEMKSANKLSTKEMKDLDVNKLNSINGEIIDKTEYKMYVFSSMCNSGLYKVNFGWGNPVRIGWGLLRVSGTCFFDDTSCRNGIEVVIVFDEPKMLKLELNKELDAIALLNHLRRSSL